MAAMVSESAMEGSRVEGRELRDKKKEEKARGERGDGTRRHGGTRRASRISRPAWEAPLAGVLHHVAGVDDGRRAALAGLEADHDVVVEVRLAVLRRLRDGDRPVLHVGEGLFEI